MPSHFVCFWLVLGHHGAYSGIGLIFCVAVFCSQATMTPLKRVTPPLKKVRACTSQNSWPCDVAADMILGFQVHAMQRVLHPGLTTVKGDNLGQLLYYNPQPSLTHSVLRAVGSPCSICMLRASRAQAAHAGCPLPCHVHTLGSDAQCDCKSSSHPVFRT